MNTHTVNSPAIVKLFSAALIGSLLSFTAHAEGLLGELEFEVDINDFVLPYDAKTYNGINCEAQSVAEIDLFLNLDFRMANANPGRRNVVCPVVRDNIVNTNGTHSVYVNVTNVPNRTLECSLYSNDAFNVTIDSDTTSTSNSGAQTLFLDVDSSLARGTYGINCLLPNGAMVESYEVREFLATDDRS